ncbi:unnamed protein product [Amoebophrya sp. A25]|nr:unnamed protein product [Amoebophrya sp. A25]|eukprot:GSA25T00008021001.1
MTEAAYVDEAGEPDAKRRRGGELTYLSAEDIQKAYDAKTISEWDFNFYKDNIGKEQLSEKQLDIKTRIENSIQINGARKQKLDEAKAAGRVNDWEHNFYSEQMLKPQLSEKQQARYDEIQGKIDGTIAPGRRGGAGQEGGFAAAAAPPVSAGGGFGQGGFGQQQMPNNFGGGFGGGPAQPGGAPPSSSAPADQMAGFGAVNNTGFGAGVGGFGQQPQAFGGNGGFEQQMGGGFGQQFGGGFGGQQQMGGFGGMQQQQPFGAQPGLGVAPQQQQPGGFEQGQGLVPQGPTGADQSQFLQTIPPEEVTQAQAANKITEWEKNFYLDIAKRIGEGLNQLSDRQAERKAEVEGKIAGTFTPEQPGGADPNAISQLWGFSMGQAEQAKTAGQISQWELNFITDNFNKQSLSEKQQVICDRIKGSMSQPAPGGGQQGGAGLPAAGQAAFGGEGDMSQAWNISRADLETLTSSGRVSEWEKGFIESNWTRQSFSEKQQKIVDRIMPKLAGAGGGGAGPSTQGAFGGGNRNQLQGGGGFGQQQQQQPFGQHGGGAGFQGQNFQQGQQNSQQQQNSFAGQQNSNPGASGRLCAFTVEQVEEARAANKINDWERGFYIDNIPKESLSEKQTQIKDRIEGKMRR